MMGAVEAARGTAALLRRGVSPRGVSRRYNRFVEASSTPFFRMVRGYYDRSFRELFLNGTGPLKVHNATLSVLAGAGLPHPPPPLPPRRPPVFPLGAADPPLPPSTRRV